MADFVTELAQARGYRLSVIMEIIEACRAAGDSIDPDMLGAVVLEGIAAIGVLPEVPQIMGDDEMAYLCALGAVGKAFKDMGILLLRKTVQTGGRTKRAEKDVKALTALETDLTAVISRHLGVLSMEQRAKVLLEAGKWGYSLWPPSSQGALIEILERARDGKRMTKALAEAAGRLVDNLRPALPAATEPTKGAAAQ